MAEEIGTVVQNEEPVDRRDVLQEAFDAAEQQQVTTDRPKPVVDRARDETGKFTAAEKAAAAKPIGGDQPKADVTAEPAQEPVWKRPPKSWKKDYHDVWAGADPRLQEYAFQREEQMAAGIQPLRTKAEFADAINKIAEPYMPVIKGLGLDVPRVVDGFFKADHILRNGQPQQKLQYLVQLARNYGIDLNGLTGAASQTPPVDPNYHAILNEVNKVRGEVLSWKEQQEQRENQVILSDIQKFAQTHEHFDTVRPVMQALLQSGQAETLDDAYKKAVRLDDSLFESEIQARQASVVSEKDSAAKKARSAAVSVRGSTPGPNTAPKAQTRREVLESNFSNIDSRL